MKKVLLLCTSHNDLGLIHSLRSLGYYIIATGNRAGSPGEKLVDKWIQADYSDKELILKIASEEKIDAICQCCNDFGVYTASYVAEKLGLPGYDSYETTLLLHNKDLFGEFAKQNGIITPASENFSSKKDALEYVESVKESNRFPLIVKPVDCSAGNGVSVVNSYEEAQNAISFAFSKSRGGRIVIEKFVKGTQHGFCTFLLNRKVVAVCSNDEISIVNPYRVEIDMYPATDGEKYRNILIDQIEMLANKLNLSDGIFHLQYIVENGKPWIIEVMRRILGNMYHVPGNMSTELDWEYWETRAKCGLDCNEMPKNSKQKGFFAYKTILADQNGTIDKVEIPDLIKKYLYDEFMLLGQGDKITDFCREPVGFLFLKFESEKEMKNILVEQYSGDFVKIRNTD